MKFRKKPVVIEAVQLTDEVCWDNWLRGVPVFGKFSVSGSYHKGDHTIHEAYVSIDTLEGVMTAKRGDWIIRGVKGEYYPCKPDIFAATYEAAE
jgi:hypothetical protein